MIEWALAWILGCAAAASLGAWWTRFRRVLPLEKELSSAREAERRRGAAEEDLRRTRERLEGGFSVLHQVAATIGSHPDKPAEMLGAIVSIAAKATESDLCAFLLYDEASGDLVTQPGAYGLTGDEGALYRMPLTNERSSSVRVFLTGEPFLTGDAMSDPRVITRYARLWRCHSLLVVPLLLEGRRIGVMRLGSFRKDFFTRDHLRLAELVAEEAVVLVESAMLHGKLSEANRRLEEINRLKDDFVSTVSHEFKTPLTAIKGFLAVLLEGDAGPLTDEQARFIRIAKSAADRLTALVMDLLDLAKLESGVQMDFAPVFLSQLVVQCAEDAEHQAKARGIGLKLAAADGRVVVRGDARWLRQLVDNLVSNALKFTPAGGVVTLSASRAGETAVITVEDTGAGISAEDQRRVFEKFFRASNREHGNAPGTGLGLAIAKFIVDKHEGRIWLESEPGKGSRFHVALPVGREAAPEELPSPPGSGAASGLGGRAAEGRPPAPGMREARRRSRKE